MSSKDRLLKQIERHSSDSLSFHQQSPTERMSNSSVTLGRIIDDSDDLIKGVNQSTVLQNGTVNNIDNCSSENIMRTISSASVGSSESLKNKADLVLDKELSGTYRSVDDPGTSGKMNISDATDDLLKSLSKLRSSSENMIDPSDKILVDSVSNVTLPENPLDILHATESSVLKVVDPSIHSTPSENSILESDEIDLHRASPNKTIQSPSSYLSHSRNLSQTTSQLTNLKETASIMDLRASGVSNFGKLDTDSLNTSDLGSLRTSDKGSKDLADNSLSSIIAQDGSNASMLMELRNSESEKEVPTFSDAPYPDWKLDRRESGHLYWRRDSSTLNGVDPSSRVKFRYDIEVCEFETRSSETEDLPEEDETEDNTEDEPEVDDGEYAVLMKKDGHTDLLESDDGHEPTVLNSRTIACVIAFVAIISAAVYRWLMDCTSATE